jgi:large subunit ribosomal protein L10
MTREEKQQVIETLKEKFSQYTNFYITDTEQLSVAQVTNLRRHCFNKQVEVKVAKNTLIKKALESLDAEKYAGIYDSLHKVTALMFSESPKEPALIISSFRKEINGQKPVLKAAFLNGDVFIGDNQLLALTKIKTKNELIGEVISLLQSPIQRVLGALQNRPEAADTATPIANAPEATAQPEPASTPEAPASPETPNPEPTADAAPETKPEA